MKVKRGTEVHATRCHVCALILSGILLSACGRVVPHGGATPSTPNKEVASAAAADMAPSDFIPSDLELVLRLDLNRVRQGLGEKEANELVGRAIDRAAASGLLRVALSKARVMWLGLRVADIEAGDRVIAIELNDGTELTPDPIAWRRHDTGVKNLTRYDATQEPSRSAFAQVFTIGQRGAVFVTPVEVHPLARVLQGADADRGQPDARGLLSADYRPGKLSTSLEDRYPSLSMLLRGVGRVHATVHFDGDQVKLESRIRCASEQAATKLLRFIDTMRDSLAASKRHSATLSQLEAKQVETAIHLSWRLPRRLVWALLSGPAKPKQTTPNGKQEPTQGAAPPSAEGASR